MWFAHTHELNINVNLPWRNFEYLKVNWKSFSHSFAQKKLSLAVDQTNFLPGMPSIRSKECLPQLFQYFLWPAWWQNQDFSNKKERDNFLLGFLSTFSSMSILKLWDLYQTVQVGSGPSDQVGGLLSRL